MKLTPTLTAVPVIALVAAAAFAGTKTGVAAGTEAAAGQDANTARDGNIAIREEFDSAEKAGTAEAWTLFLARHPDHPLAAPARDRLAALQGKTAPPQD
ncbi:hypothetical protein [Psychromarinibacter sp. S121]|uniref:hypothetical protein n=1 Tax=Psychromarinibacter sp. S121 TaxID=3415127 RepID=UPI003C7C09EC